MGQLCAGHREKIKGVGRHYKRFSPSGTTISSPYNQIPGKISSATTRVAKDGLLAQSANLG